MVHDFPEYNQALNIHKELKRKLGKSRRDIEKINKKFQFIRNIFSEGAGGISLEAELCKLFKEIGYKIVRHLNQDNRNVDIQIEVGNRLTCIEVKSIKNTSIQENEIFQLVKYRNRKREEFQDEQKQVKGVFVLNHENTVTNHTTGHF